MEPRWTALPTSSWRKGRPDERDIAVQAFTPGGQVAFPGGTLTAVDQAYRQRIANDPAICGGQPVIRGTRVLVRTILGYLAHGESTDAIRRDFPTVSEEDIRAVIAFAAAAASEDLPAPAPLPTSGRAA